jgi:hypothetical protein
VTDPPDAATVVGVVGAVVAVEADVAPAESSLLVSSELAAVDELDVAFVAVVALVAVFVVLPPAWAASPANRPVPATAPASDARVTFLMRRSPASRSRRLRADTGRPLMHRLSAGAL